MIAKMRAMGTQDQINEAIDDSIREDRIVTIEDVVYESAQFNSLAVALDERSDGSVETENFRGATIAEYWGTRDGRPWRVHIECVGG